MSDVVVFSPLVRKLVSAKSRDLYLVFFILKCGLCSTMLSIEEVVVVS